MPYFHSMKRHVASWRGWCISEKLDGKLLHKCLHLICRMSVVSTVSKFCSPVFYFSLSLSPLLLSWPRLKWNVKTVRVANAGFIYSKSSFLFPFCCFFYFYFLFLACEPDVFLFLSREKFVPICFCKNILFCDGSDSVMFTHYPERKVYLNWRFYIF